MKACRAAKIDKRHSERLTVHQEQSAHLRRHSSSGERHGDFRCLRIHVVVQPKQNRTHGAHPDIGDRLPVLLSMMSSCPCGT